jgi:hypothetical protein
MTHDAYSTKRVTVWESEKDGQPGYAIKYRDGYISWCPKAVYERDYQPLDALSFGHAIEALHRGERVARAGWNGVGMWLTLVSTNWNGSFSHHGSHAPADWVGNQPFVVIFNASKEFALWQPSQADMLAKDWQVLPGVVK